MMRPDVARSRSAMTRSSVVLPQPDGPIRETNSPCPTFRSMCDSAWTGPSAVSKVSERSWMAMTDWDRAVPRACADARSSIADVAARVPSPVRTGEGGLAKRGRMRASTLSAATCKATGPGFTGAKDSTPLIRHGCAMTPSPAEREKEVRAGRHHRAIFFGAVSCFQRVSALAGAGNGSRAMNLPLPRLATTSPSL